MKKGGTVWVSPFLFWCGGGPPHRGKTGAVVVHARASAVPTRRSRSSRSLSMKWAIMVR
jgi:hypothetical protein